MFALLLPFSPLQRVELRRATSRYPSTVSPPLYPLTCSTLPQEPTLSSSISSPIGTTLPVLITSISPPSPASSSLTRSSPYATSLATSLILSIHHCAPSPSLLGRSYSIFVATATGYFFSSTTGHLRQEEAAWRSPFSTAPDCIV